MADLTSIRNLFRLRRLTSFSLRTALIAVSIFGVWLGLHIRSVKSQRASVEAVQRFGGWAHYDYEVGADFLIDQNPTSPVPVWLLKSFGRDHFHDVVCVNMVYDDKGGRHYNGNRSSEILDHLGGFPSLEDLRLYGAQPTDGGLKEVGRLTNLRRLSMSEASSVTDRGVACLGELEKLEYLQLHEAWISDESLRILARLPKLQRLSVEGGNITDRGLEHMQDMPQLRHLTLAFGFGDITDAGLVHLGKCKELQVLDLRDCEVTDEGLRHLAGLKKLRGLRLGWTQVKNVSWLQQRLPNCKIRL